MIVCQNLMIHSILVAITETLYLSSRFVPQKKLRHLIPLTSASWGLCGCAWCIISLQCEGEDIFRLLLSWIIPVPPTRHSLDRHSDYANVLSQATAKADSNCNIHETAFGTVWIDMVHSLLNCRSTQSATRSARQKPIAIYAMILELSTYSGAVLRSISTFIPSQLLSHPKWEAFLLQMRRSSKLWYNESERKRVLLLKIEI